MLLATVLLPALNLKDKQRGAVVALVVDVMRKLEAVRYHRDRCLEVIEAHARQTKPVEGMADHADLTTGIEHEVESVVMQVKSTLDVIVKILRPLAGLSLETYGDAGDRVVKALTRNLPKAKQERAEALVQLVEEAKGEWVAGMKVVRDDIDHRMAVGSSGVTRRPDGTVTEPVLSIGMRATEYVEILYFNALTFCEDFLALACRLAMHDAVDIVTISTSERANPESTHKYQVVAVQRSATGQGKKP
jgi:hypothetical protein